MSRKHYVIIANAIKEARYNKSFVSSQVELNTVDFVASQLAIALKSDNGNFDSFKFLSDCK
jgi:hypothetical protein